MGNYNDYTKNFGEPGQGLKVVTRKDETGAIRIDKIIHPNNTRKKNTGYNEEKSK